MKIHGLRFVERRIVCNDGMHRTVNILQMEIAPDEKSEKYGGYHPIWVDVPLIKKEQHND